MFKSVWGFIKRVARAVFGIGKEVVTSVIAIAKTPFALIVAGYHNAPSTLATVPFIIITLVAGTIAVLILVLTNLAVTIACNVYGVFTGDFEPFDLDQKLTEMYGSPAAPTTTEVVPTDFPVDFVYVDFGSGAVT